MGSQKCEAMHWKLSGLALQALHLISLWVMSLPLPAYKILVEFYLHSTAAGKRKSVDSTGTIVEIKVKTEKQARNLIHICQDFDIPKMWAMSP